MKKRRNTVVGCLVVLLLGTPAYGENYGQYDQDGDGVITFEEYHSSTGAFPWNGDTNGDGLYSIEEIEDLRELALQKKEDGDGTGIAHLGNLDENFDGKLSYEEFQAGFPNVKSNPDTDGDGHIDRSELDSLRENSGRRDNSSGARGKSSSSLGRSSQNGSKGRGR